MSVFNEEYGENEQVLEPSIFKGDNYEKFRETELEIIVSNIGKIQERLFFTNNLECLSAFEKENADMISSYLKNYNINGVGMEFGASWNLMCISGVAIPADLYSLLKSTGLCYPAI